MPSRNCLLCPGGLDRLYGEGLWLRLGIYHIEDFMSKRLGGTLHPWEFFCESVISPKTQALLLIFFSRYGFDTIPILLARYGHALGQLAATRYQVWLAGNGLLAIPLVCPPD